MKVNWVDFEKTARITTTHFGNLVLAVSQGRLGIWIPPIATLSKSRRSHPDPEAILATKDSLETASFGTNETEEGFELVCQVVGRRQEQYLTSRLIQDPDRIRGHLAWRELLEASFEKKLRENTSISDIEGGFW
ncbi:hypothetical protein G7046_g236 [Stylonectria norvegica]|nr:hypothetical protein G7046_g236 [Stylonectria norvegica]